MQQFVEWRESRPHLELPNFLLQNLVFYHWREGNPNSFKNPKTYGSSGGSSLGMGKKGE